MAVTTVNPLEGSRLAAVLLGNTLLRVAAGAGGALVGFYLAHQAVQGLGATAALVGGLAVVHSGAELVSAIPFGTLTDRYPPRTLMVIGALLGAVATQLFGMTGLIAVFYLSRALEGISVCAGGPALLAHLTDATHTEPKARGRVMSFYELSLLMGLALGTVVGGTLWDRIGTASFSMLAAVYALVAVLFYWGSEGSHPPFTPSEHTLNGLKRAFSDPLLRRLAPAWLAMNAIVGMWLVHSSFQLTGPHAPGQFLSGTFTASQAGLILLAFALIFATGVTGWGFLLARIPRVTALRINLVGMAFVCFFLYLLNSSENWSNPARLLVLAGAIVGELVESGFTPAALAYLADVVSKSEGRGTAMGIYSVLLAVGAGLGAGVGGLLAQQFAFNGLIFSTIGLEVVALATLALLPNHDPRGAAK